MKQIITAIGALALCQLAVGQETKEDLDREVADVLTRLTAMECLMKVEGKSDIESAANMLQGCVNLCKRFEEEPEEMCLQVLREQVSRPIAARLGVELP